MRRSARQIPLLGNRSNAALFLCWHSIAHHGPRWLVVSPELFERQVALLRRLGYRSGGAKELDELATGQAPRSPTVFLTFDDGFADNAHTARPILEAYGMRAIVFVLPPLLDEGAPFAWPAVRNLARDHPGLRSMTWAQAEQLIAGGHELGSHTCSHAALSGLSDDRLRDELLLARDRLVEKVGSCELVAYPFGDWDRRVVAAARSAGHRFGFALPWGPDARPDPLAIPRLVIDHRDSESRLRLRVTAAYRRLALSAAAPLARALIRTVRRAR